MGYIRIEIGGSFVGAYGITSVAEEFNALVNGHADAATRAAAYLCEVVLPRATALDHDLHRQGQAPSGGFTPKRILLDTADE